VSKEPENFEDERPREEVPPALLKKALEDLQELVRGNGMKPEGVTQQSFDGEVLNFEAFEVFKIEPSVGDKRMPGKQKGEVAGSYTDAQQKIKAALEKIARDKEVRRMTRDLLKKREDLGFAIDNLIINLERLNKKFVTHDSCGPCGATGKLACAYCKGKRQIACTKCLGKRQVMCQACRGSQFVNTPKGRQQCNVCRGRGRVNCRMCRQTGFMQCPRCKSGGKMRCQHCAGTGWNSRVFFVRVKAKAMFRYDREALPEDVPPLIDEYGPLLVTDRHAQVRFIEDQRRDEELDRLSKPDEMYIAYHVKIPWGDIEYMMQMNEVKAKLFGFTPMLEKMPPVLEKIMNPGMKSLAQAAEGTGNISQHVTKAISYRGIGELLLAAIPNPPQRIAEIMRENYRYGIYDETLGRMAEQAIAALRNLTKRPRLQGLALGAIFSGILYASYFMGPLRGTILAQLGTAFPQLIPDLGMAICGGAAITGVIHLMATQTLKSVLHKAVEESKSEYKIKLAPKPVESGLWGYPAGVLLFALVLYLSVMQGFAAPDWYAMLVPQQQIQQPPS